MLPWLIYACGRLRTGAARAAFVTAGVLFGMVLNFCIIWKTGQAEAMFAPQDLMIFKIFINKPYTKLYSVFLGIGMGFLFLDIRANKQNKDSPWSRLSASAVYAVTSFSLTFLLILYLIFSPHSANLDPLKWTRLHNSLYVSISRPLFIMCLMVMMTNFFLGHGKLLKAFFSLSIWAPMARVSYLVYLMFFMLNSILLSSMSESIYLNVINVIYLLIGNYIFHFAAAFIVSLLVEQPIQSVISMKLKSSS